SHIKRQLQYETWKKPVCSGKYSLSAEEISRDIFVKIAEKIKKEQRVEEIEAVLTYPVTFSEHLKKKLKGCAEQAGIKVIEMLTEPFAAMFSDEIIEKFEESKKEYNCIIFDFGGSTLDICLIRASGKEKKKIELLASSGMVFGGYDISELIFNDIILENFKKEIDEADKNHTYSRHASISELRPQAEELKVNLNQSDCEDDDTEEIAFLGKRVSISKKDINDMLDKHEINKKIKDLIINMIDSVDEGMETDDISEVIMVGGTSHMTYFQDIIKEIFEDEDIIDEDILEDDAVFYNSVSCGAARYISEKENYDISKTIPLAVGF
ncbi:MAG: Hsp70 family protein, partial [Oscillospiraceae bacterium]|nr:Hsp70 family protein [Oscillospiraceae bacterium]